MGDGTRGKSLSPLNAGPQINAGLKEEVGNKPLRHLIVV